MTLEQFISTFRNISTLHKGLKTFVYGEPERLVGMQRGNLEYPLMYLETPTIQIEYNEQSESASIVFSGAFSIMKHCANGDYPVQDAAQNECHGIAIDILARLLKEAQEEEPGTLFSFYPNMTNGEPLSMYMVDNDYGYRISFRLSADLDLCFDASKWDDGEVVPDIINKVINTSESYEQIVSGTVVLPDIILTAPDGSTFEFPSCENIDTRELEDWPTSGSSSFTVVIKYENGTLISTNTVTDDTELTVPNPRPADQYTVIVRTVAGSTIATQEVSTDNAIIEVPNYPADASGIAYVDFIPAQRQNYESGRVDVGANFAASRYNRTQPVRPLRYAKLNPADPTGKTLLENNIHGNTHRFTDANGNPGPFTYSYTANVGAVIAFQDHYHGGWWVGYDTTRSFTLALDDIASLNVNSIGTTWLCPDQDMVSTIQVLNGSAATNLLFECGMTSGTYWTGLTRPDLTTQGYRIQGVTLGISAQTKSTANRWFAFKYF